MQRDRSPDAQYVPDNPGDSTRQLSYDDLYRQWEQVLKFVVGGKDES